MHIAFLGIGLMGRPLAERCLQAGHRVTVYNRTAQKTEPLTEQGAEQAASPAAALTEASHAVLTLSDAAAIRQVLQTPLEKGLLRDRTLIQMGTIGPTESRALAEWIHNAGGRWLEAPVLGSIPEARTGSLIVMVGADDAEEFARNRELLGCFGGQPMHIGPVGQAAALKLALNQLIASLTAGFALSLGLVRHAGIDTQRFMELLRGSALYAPTFDKKLERMLDREYRHPNFPTRHLLKDVDLFLAEARDAGLHTSMLEGIRTLLQETMARGLADRDYSALYDTVDPSPSQAPTAADEDRPAHDR
jgi:3-hydroxyisobutyrate dehydrogenase